MQFLLDCGVSGFGTDCTCLTYISSVSVTTFHWYLVGNILTTVQFDIGVQIKLQFGINKNQTIPNQGGKKFL